VNAQGRYAIPRWRLELVANFDQFTFIPVIPTDCDVEVANVDFKLLNSTVVS
jgi:hypothetical protein